MTESEEVGERRLLKWADAAMYQSEPMPFDVNKDGPQVYLLEMSSDPLGQIAAACKMYRGEVVRSLSEITDVERQDYFRQVQRTKLQAPFEFVKFHFMIEGVSRSLTHQMVRQRTAVYAQESLRFAVKDGTDMRDEVLLPPSLASQPDDAPLRTVWDQAIDFVDDAYNGLIAAGMPAEDARGLLPHNITTRLHYSTDLRALLDHAGNRLCTQAQFEWRLLWTRIRQAIREYDNGGKRWQYQTLSEVFKPVCYQIGKCGFKANFDRPCAIRDRVDFNEAHGVAPTEWGEEAGESGGMVPEGWRPIYPEEWLLNPGAARGR